MKSSPHLPGCIKPRPSILEPISPWAFLNPSSLELSWTILLIKRVQMLNTKSALNIWAQYFPASPFAPWWKGVLVAFRDSCSIHHSSCSLHWITIRCSGVLIYIPKYQNGTLMQSAIVLKCIVVSWFKTVLSIKVIVRCKMYNLEVYAQSHSMFMFVHE